ncbi:MAG: hypothetical protein ABEI96_02240 [Haloarculaceae archaeon]
MQSLGEAYDRRNWQVRDGRRLAVGSGLFAAGALALVVALLLVTTPLSGLVGATAPTVVKRYAGTLAGLAVPALLLGVVVVVPSSRRERAGALVGATLSVVGVGLFWYAYPAHWTGTTGSLAFETAMVYFLGSIVALWFEFTAVATYKTRNTPGGTVTLSVKRQGDTRTVQVSQQQYDEYRKTLRSDGGDDQQVIEDLLNE